MASTYSTSLKLTLIGDGDQSGIWGQTTNTNFGTLVEQAITGVVNITMADANYTLTSFNGVTDEARNAVLVIGGTNSAIYDVIPPLVKKVYTVVNNTVGGYAIRVIGATGTGVNIPNGFSSIVYCDGTNFYQAVNSGAGAVTTSNFTIQQSGTTLVFQYNGANIATLSSTGAFAAVNLAASANVSAANVIATTNVTATKVAASANVTAGGEIISAGNITAYGSV